MDDNLQRATTSSVQSSTKTVCLTDVYPTKLTGKVVESVLISLLCILDVALS